MTAASKPNKPSRAHTPASACDNNNINNNTTVNKGGRPYKYTVEDFNNLVDQYIADRTGKNLPITKNGLSLYIRCDPDTITNLSDVDGYSEAIKRVVQAGEQYEVDFIHSGKNPAGAIFVLKNLHGWTDKQEINVNNRLTIDVAPATLEQCKAAVQLRERFEQACLDVPGEVLEAKTEPI
jgi:hypothetical protein